jgi:predicted ribosome quality control (RQC) complex YloA/Tae2 family protein
MSLRIKRVLSPPDLLGSVAEMSGLQGSRVENVYRSGAGLLLKLSSGLVAVTKFRVSLTGIVPERSHRGAETLRGLFRGARLVRVSMPRFDRIAEFELSPGRLVVELVEPFNVIAVREGRVVWLLRSYRGRGRELRPGLPYAHPPAAFVDLLSAEISEIERAIDPGDLKRSLVRRLGTGPDLAEELVARAGASPRAIAEELKAIVDRVRSGALEPSVCIREGVPVTVMPIRPAHLKCDEVRQFEHFWAALDFYFGPLELELAAARSSQEAEQRRRRLEATIAELRERIPELRGEAGRLKSTAHKLLIYKSEIEEALGGSEASVRVVHVYGKSVKVELPGGEQVEIRRDVPLGRQISEMFNRARELEGKAARAEQALKRLEEELESLSVEIERIRKRVISAVKVVAERSWFEKFRWTVTAGRRPVIGGRDASQNGVIVRRYLKERYLFFHADIPGAPVVVSPPTDDPLEILQVAQFAAAYSRAWRMGLHAIDVFYARGEQVSKQAPAGQYLARGSFMVYGKREHVRGVRMELAVGFRRDGGACRVVAAPPRSAPLLAERYVVLAPGNVERGRLARELAGRWEGCGADEIAAALPGPSRVLEEGRGSPIPWEGVKRIFAAW